MRVLLIEDDPMIGEEVKRALRAAAYATDWVVDGSQAIVALQTHGYDLVLLDLGLPGRDGHEVLSFVRRRDTALPVLS